MQRRRIALLATGLAATLLAIFLLQNIPGCSPGDLRLLKQARREFAELNSQLPQWVDALTRLDSAKVDGAREWSYYYTVERDGSVLSLPPAEFRQKIEANAVQTIRGNFGIDGKNKLGVTFRYFYSTERGDWKAEVVITPSMYE